MNSDASSSGIADSAYRTSAREIVAVVTMIGRENLARCEARAGRVKAVALEAAELGLLQAVDMDVYVLAPAGQALCNAADPLGHFVARIEARNTPGKRVSLEREAKG